MSEARQGWHSHTQQLLDRRAPLTPCCASCCCCRWVYTLNGRPISGTSAAQTVVLTGGSGACLLPLLLLTVAAHPMRHTDARGCLAAAGKNITATAQGLRSQDLTVQF